MQNRRGFSGFRRHWARFPGTGRIARRIVEFPLARSTDSFGLPVPARVGRNYVPIRIVGSGGMGVVYEVEHSVTRARLALKLLRRGAFETDGIATARFRREARVSSLVSSPHIVRVLDADVDLALGVHFIVMDLLEGTNLAAFEAGAPQPAERVVAWLRQVASGLDAAHAAGVVHRDLKLGNLFLANEPQGQIVKILDFGVAKLNDVEEPTFTVEGAIVGTPRYMAPEQAVGGAVGPGTDIWSLAMCAYRLLSGRDYWQAPAAAQVLADIVHGSISPPSTLGLTLGTEFDAWFATSCARDPSDRWSSAGEQIEALANALTRPSVGLPGATRFGEPRPRLRVERGVMALATASALALTGIAAERLLERSSHARSGAVLRGSPEPSDHRPPPVKMPAATSDTAPLRGQLASVGIPPSAEVPRAAQRRDRDPAVVRASAPSTATKPQATASPLSTHSVDPLADPY